MGDFFFLKILMKTNIGGRRREKEGDGFGPNIPKLLYGRV